MIAAMTKQYILVVEDDDIQRRQLVRALNCPEYEIIDAGSGETALKILAGQQFDLVISDLRMPGISGIELTERIKGAFPQTSVLLITAHASVDSAVEAMKIGAEDYLKKPFGNDELDIVVKKIFEKRELLAENVLLREQIESQFSFERIISKNHQMRKIFKVISSVAVTNSTILIQGETGTGKELIAQAIHHNSPRKTKQFVAVNCGAVPDTLLEAELFGHEKGAFTGAVVRRIGKFEYADGGTLFLDEIGNMSSAMQVKLLRALEEKRFQRLGSNAPIEADIRLIAATNVNLQALVESGEFRNDLFYRINVIPIHIPPLRDRIEDIPLLANHFLKVYADRLGRETRGLSPGATRKLMKHHWPGNVRELENVIERTVATTTEERIKEGDLPPDFAHSAHTGHIDPASFIDTPLTERVAEVERDYLTALLRRFRGKTALAAEKAGLSLRTLQRKMKDHGISSDNFRERGVE
jgi:DNA-binding NtrC family response regulator